MPRILYHRGKPFFYCPGCQTLHQLDTRWPFNYNADRPTFKGEIRLTAGPFPAEHPLAGQTIRCVSVVRDGQIHFTQESTHALRGQSVMLPDPQDEIDKRAATKAAGPKDQDALTRDPAIEPKVKAEA